jgi:hypothetical protein
MSSPRTRNGQIVRSSSRTLLQSRLQKKFGTTVGVQSIERQGEDDVHD